MNGPVLVAAIGIAGLVILLIVIVLAMNRPTATLYDEPEIFQVTLAGKGIGDGTQTLSEDNKQQIADSMSTDYGTEYSVPTREQVKSLVAGTDAQWCQPGWTTGDTWPLCYGLNNTSVSTCCGGVNGTLDWHDLNPQPALYLYGRKPKKGVMPLCDDPSVESGTACISYWSSGGNVGTPKYSMYD